MSAISESTLAGRAPKKLPKRLKVIDMDIRAFETPSALELITKMPAGYLAIPLSLAHNGIQHRYGTLSPA